MIVELCSFPHLCGVCPLGAGEDRSVEFSSVCAAVPKTAQIVTCATVASWMFILGFLVAGPQPCSLKYVCVTPSGATEKELSPSPEATPHSHRSLLSWVQAGIRTRFVCVPGGVTKKPGLLVGREKSKGDSRIDDKVIL